MQQVQGSIRTADERETLFIALYKSAFPDVARYVHKMGGSFEDAKDIFHDALVIYYEKSVAPGFVINSTPKAYLIGISKHLWLHKFKETNLNMPLDGFDCVEESQEQHSESKLMHFLETAGKKCMELLRSFYYDKVPLTDAAKLFGFSGIRSATVQKYKCLEKVRETVKEKSLSYEDFVD